MTVRASFDEGKTWPVAKLLNSGPSAYSDLAVLANGEIACLYEGGTDYDVQYMMFASFPLDSLTLVPCRIIPGRRAAGQRAARWEKNEAKPSANGTKEANYGTTWNDMLKIFNLDIILSTAPPTPYRRTDD